MIKIRVYFYPNFALMIQRDKVMLLRKRSETEWKSNFDC